MHSYTPPVSYEAECHHVSAARTSHGGLLRNVPHRSFCCAAVMRHRRSSTQCFLVSGRVTSGTLLPMRHLSVRGETVDFDTLHFDTYLCRALVDIVLLSCTQRSRGRGLDILLNNRQVQDPMGGCQPYRLHRRSTTIGCASR